MNNHATAEPLRYEKLYDRASDNWRIVKYETADGEETTEDHLATVDTEAMADMLIAMLAGPTIAIDLYDGRVQDVLCPPEITPQLRILVVDHDVKSHQLDEDTAHTLYVDAKGKPRLVNVYLPEVVHPGGASDIELATAAYLSPTRFPLGRLRATAAAIEAIDQSGDSPFVFLARHAAGDWGNVCDEDKQLNDQSVQDGSRILSAYHTSKDVKLWVLTEATDDDGRRAATTIMLPDEY